MIQCMSIESVVQNDHNDVVRVSYQIVFALEPKSAQVPYSVTNLAACADLLKTAGAAICGVSAVHNWMTEGREALTGASAVHCGGRSRKYPTSASHLILYDLAQEPSSTAWCYRTMPEYQNQ